MKKLSDETSDTLITSTQESHADTSDREARFLRALDQAKDFIDGRKLPEPTPLYHREPTVHAPEPDPFWLRLATFFGMLIGGAIAALCLFVFFKVSWPLWAVILTIAGAALLGAGIARLITWKWGPREIEQPLSGPTPKPEHKRILLLKENAPSHTSAPTQQPAPNVAASQSDNPTHKPPSTTRKG